MIHRKETVAGRESHSSFKSPRLLVVDVELVRYANSAFAFERLQPKRGGQHGHFLHSRTCTT